MITSLKVNSELNDDQFQVEIKNSDTLQSINFKRVKVKLNDGAGKELVGHYFNPNDLKGEEKSKCIMQIPQAYQTTLRQQKLIVVVKRSKMMSFEENINKQEVNLHGLTSKNEVMKQVKFTDSSGAKVSFDVYVRVKQSHKKDEVETKTVTEVKPGELVTPFDIFKAQQDKINPAPQKPA